MYWHAAQAELVVTEAELLAEICIGMSDRDISSRKPYFEPIVKKITGEGLISSEGDKWV